MKRNDTIKTKIYILQIKIDNLQDRIENAFKCGDNNLAARLHKKLLDAEILLNRLEKTHPIERLMYDHDGK